MKKIFWSFEFGWIDWLGGGAGSLRNKNQELIRSGQILRYNKMRDIRRFHIEKKKSSLVFESISHGPRGCFHFFFSIFNFVLDRNSSSHLNIFATRNKINLAITKLYQLSGNRSHFRIFALIRLDSNLTIFFVLHINLFYLGYLFRNNFG